ncbi:MAG: RNA methyltransferase [Firmicutes bacterium]|nr:RNA methyltransferase [Bacillota bacterium]
MRILTVESSKNAEYKKLLQLQKEARARKEGLFVLEGVRAVSELAPDWQTESIWISESFAGAVPERLEARYYRISDAMFAKAAGTVHAQGILAVVHRKDHTLQDVPVHAGFWIVLENLQDPGNAGTILRTADACGADALICTKGTVDLYNQKVVRSSMGSLFHLPVVSVEDIAEAAAFVHDQGGQLIGTHLKGTTSYTDASYQGPTAIIIGNEGSGMSREAADLCDVLVRIPMPGQAESLNASVAAGVMMYEVLRQRG